MANPTSPILQTPSDNLEIIGNVLVFTFTASSDADNNLIVFRIELDTTNPINPLSDDYIKFESGVVGENGFFLYGDFYPSGILNDKEYILNSTNTGGESFDIWEFADTGEPIPVEGIGPSDYGKTIRVKLRLQEVVSYPNINTKWYWRISASDKD